MLHTLIRAPLVVLALAVLPLSLSAQQRTATRQPQVRPTAGAPALTAEQREMQAWYAELQQIGARLQAAHARAMQDPALRARQEALARDFRAAVLRVDPGLAGVEGRARTMEAEARRAQQAGDQASFMKLMEEARQIEIRIMNAQKKLLEDPAFAGRVRAFETELRKKMVEVEPQTPQLIARAELLQGKLMQAMRQAQQD